MLCLGDEGSKRLCLQSFWDQSNTYFFNDLAWDFADIIIYRRVVGQITLERFIRFDEVG
jgi:hypothetical protein